MIASRQDKAQKQTAATPIQILLIDDNRVEARLMQSVLAKVEQSSTQRFQIHWAETLTDGLTRLNAGGIDLVLLDLTLPDADRSETLARVFGKELDTPVVVLTGIDDELLADEALKRGAQDYLVKGQISSQLLVRAIRYAIERHRLLRSLSLFDDLTGLYNRRGFQILADQQLKLARRKERDFIIIYADMDGLKQINDQYGHQEGSLAIIKCAELLRQSFRNSDIIARIGGDEFAIMAIDASESDASQLIVRLQETIRRYNAESNKPYLLSLSTGVSRSTISGDFPLDDLLKIADEAMYEQKRSKRRASNEPRREILKVS